MILRFPVPEKPWSINETPTSVHAKIKQHGYKTAWRDTAYVVARAATARDPRRGLGPSNIQVTIPFNTNRRRDPHNYTGTVVKAVVDGLTRAGLWPDDNVEHVTVLDPILVVGTEVIVTITPRTVVGC